MVNSVKPTNISFGPNSDTSFKPIDGYYFGSDFDDFNINLSDITSIQSSMSDEDFDVNPINPSDVTASEPNIADFFVKEAGLAQYKGSDYSNAVWVERGITLDQAFEIANEVSEADYFVYSTGWMYLEIPRGVQFDPNNDRLGLVTYDAWSHTYYRIFYPGDVVFFKNEGKWLGTAPGMADVYSKKQ